MKEGSSAEEMRSLVRQRYAAAAQEAGQGRPCCSSSCCGGTPAAAAVERETQLGYTAEELGGAPEAAGMSLGCGNPTAIAALRPGEVVLDLGSGGGLDCTLAARQVGPKGRVIGVDMTPEMLSRARENAARRGLRNVEYRLGEIEHLPVADGEVDVIISNCAVNLSPDKAAVFREAYRVLKPGGRLAISDIVATAPLPEEARQDAELWSCCIAGAATIDELERALRAAGFEGIRIEPLEASREMIRQWAPDRPVGDYVLSAAIEAVKPG